ncbi:diphthamide biosynthesis enzyme Dph2 [Candidatus Geothermarchaeota archaeon ex4572_27]|nr:MAG: diphthamide biosynthesis enzyme Dph2 [Candidatus Geothermarchaeota archaeon ex4572_27]
MYDFKVDEVVEEVRRLGASKVAVQMPEGLKPYATRLASEIEARAGCAVYVLADPCYGGCDVALDEALRLGVDLLVHFGHTEVVRHHGGLKVLYVEAQVDAPIAGLVEEALRLVDGGSIGVVGLVQHAHRLREAVEAIERAGRRAVLPQPKGRAKWPGQVIGCDYSTARSVAGEVDAFIYVGGGLMHPVGVALSTGRRVVAVDPVAGRVEDVAREVRRLLAVRASKISEASEAEVFGVVVGLRPGQYRPGLADRVAEELARAGRRAFRLACRELSPSIEACFPEVEAFVVTSCPLIPLFDQEAYRRPLLTPQEALLAVRGGWSVEDYDPFKWF